MENFWAEELREMHEARRASPRPLGSIPLVVLAARRPEGSPPQGVTEQVGRELGEEKRAQRADLATLSTRGELVVDPASGHHVHLDNPGLVAGAVRRVIEAVRAASGG